jgi:hypothetical protein
MTSSEFKGYVELPLYDKLDATFSGFGLDILLTFVA